MRKRISTIKNCLIKGNLNLHPLFILSMLIILLSCKKGLECETWEVRDSGCTETGSCYYVGCNSYPDRVHEVSVCGDQLNEARPNNTITIKSECVTRQRTYLRKM